MALYWAKTGGRNAAIRYTPQAAARHAGAGGDNRIEAAKALAAIRALAAAVDAKDPYTQRHSERVAELASGMAQIAGWDPDRITLLRDTALVHDVGKIGVPDQILFKPGRLTAAEYDTVKTHAALGAQMLIGLLTPEQTDWIRHHHERYDGAGYPDGLAGADIAEGARLLAVADAWDAMTVARPYGRPRTADEALDECRRSAGTHFCPKAVDALQRFHDTAARPSTRDRP
jgi:HD-GYP domain-containing protein (c-di-GMP phosphodiesterase class II)